MNADTGAYAWHYQTTPRDAWDYDAVQQIMTADLPIGGKTTRVAMQANKNGFFYVIDVATGRLISADKFVPVDWAEKVDLATGRPVEAPFARYKGAQDTTVVSGPGGGHNWTPMAFSPKTGLVYIPAATSPGYYAQAKAFAYAAGNQNTGMQRPYQGPNAPKPAPSTRPPAYGELVAWDPVAKAARWRVRMPQPINGGVLATDGGLIFHPEQNRFTARDAATGQALWSYDTGAYAISAASTYEIDGEQYVAQMVGWGGIGGMGGNQPRRKGRLLVFKLGGTAHAAAYPQPAVIPPLDLAAAEPSKGDADRGGLLYAANCVTCHRGGVFLPNLSRSPAVLSAAGFRSIVLGGALSANGMASFRKFLTPAQVEDLRAYFLWSAKNPPKAPPAPLRVEH
jgi:quinohemoprotein ethanol dehydrogenase